MPQLLKTSFAGLSVLLTSVLMTPLLASAQWDEDGTENQDDSGSDPLVTTTDYSDSNPPPPEGADLHLGDRDSIDVAHDAGVGSELAYASESVLELGGTLAFTHRSETTRVSIAPFIGYFIVDGLQLSLFPRFEIIHVSGSDTDPTVDGRTDFTIGAILEPSYHLAFTDALYGFVGFGLGLKFAKDQSADFVVRPRVGVDILVGRSSILKPAFFMDIGAADGLGDIGVEASFSAMW